MLKTLVLAAGESKRFRDSRWENWPKQFIGFHMDLGPPGQMWENTLHGLTTPSKITYVAINESHADFIAPQRLKYARAIWMRTQTSGQGETLFVALNHMDWDGEILIVNCDQGFAPGVLDNLVRSGRNKNQPAALTFTASPGEANRWSYVDNHPCFFKAAEKEAIGPRALAGAYYFPDLDALVDQSQFALLWAKAQKVEPYISHIYNFIDGPKLSVDVDRKDCYDWGTPEALERFLSEYSPYP